MAEPKKRKKTAEQAGKTKTHSSLLSLWDQRWVRIVSYLALAGVVIMIAVPIAMQHYLQRWLIDNGADEAVIRDIDFNPFVGSLRIERLDVKIDNRTVMGDVDIYLNIGLTALITRTITVERAVLDKVRLEIERLEDGRMRIGSLIVGEPVSVEPDIAKGLVSDDKTSTKVARSPAEPPPIAEAEPAQEGRPWQINLRDVSITNSEIRYLSPELNTTLAVTSATINRMYTGFSQERGAIKLDAQLDGTPVMLDLAATINPGISVQGRAKVDGLKMKPLLGLVKEHVKDLGGVFNLDGGFTFSSGPRQPVSAKFNGGVSLTDTALSVPNVRVSGQALGWNGTVTFDADQPDQDIGVDGKISLGKLSAELPEQAVGIRHEKMDIEARKVRIRLSPDQVDISGRASVAGSTVEVEKPGTGLLSLAGLVAKDVEVQNSKQISAPSIELTGLAVGSPKLPDVQVTLDSLVLESTTVANLSEVSVGHLRSTQLQALDQAKAVILAQIGELGVSEVKASGATRISAQQIALGETTVLSKPSKPDIPPVGRIGKTNIASVTYTPEGVTIDTVDINGIKANLVRTKSFKPPKQETGAKSPAGPANEVGDEKRDTEKQTAQPVDTSEKGEGFKFSIGELGLSGDNVIYVEDRSVTPTFRNVLRISALKLKSRDREQAFGPMDINLTGTYGEYGHINASGMIDPSAHSSHMKLAIDDANMIVLTPYTIRMMGYQVNSGHLSLDSAIHIADGRMDAKNGLFLRELYMDRVSEEFAAAAEAEIGMPVGKALDLLRNKHGNIKLDVPISGALSDLQFGLGDAIGKAVQTALKSATITYLKFINPTYGIGATVVEKIKKQIEKVRIGPVLYEAGESKLPEAGTKFLSDVAAELRKDEKSDVRVCPHTSPGDVTALGGAPADKDLGKEVLDKMVQLGHDRASAIKKKLISEFSIHPGRVIICVNKYDHSENAKGRVEFKF